MGKYFNIDFLALNTSFLDGDVIP